MRWRRKAAKLAIGQLAGPPASVESEVKREGVNCLEVFAELSLKPVQRRSGRAETPHTGRLVSTYNS